MSVDRALRLIAGTFVFASAMLGMFVHPNFYWFTAFVGFNLFQSGFTRFCPMDIMLKKVGVKSGCGL